jgi:hypothetical protein
MNSPFGTYGQNPGTSNVGSPAPRKQPTISFETTIFVLILCCFATGSLWPVVFLILWLLLL